TVNEPVCLSTQSSCAAPGSAFSVTVMWLVAVTAGLFTDVDACPAATVELPQEENPARPFTAKPRPVPVCSAKMPIPASALAAPWTPFPPPVLPSTPIPLLVGCTGGWPPGGTSVL